LACYVFSKQKKAKVMIGNLDNEVIFKKAFTNKFVLKCLVKDLFGVEFEAETVETEKRFEPKISGVDFKYDVFAQSKDKRVIVEIQRVDYDYNFDRFLLYHNMAIAEMQRTSKEYKTNRVVYTIVVFTGRYVAKDREGTIIQKDILFHYSNLFDLNKKEYDVFGHKLIFLNHNYVENTTPQGYRDWLMLVKESIKNPEEPQINLANEGIKKVTELIDYEYLSPEERTESKNRHAAESARKLYEEEIKLRNQIEIAKKMLKRGTLIAEIAEDTGLTIQQVEQLRNE
jgi:predicted transposase/invertase (TIGR01784 family)